ncbi:molybdate ABC transporter, inner membrane subunit [Desulfobulbus propionicus DSM 2032]|jgi:molybdate transport system permease protein|uniref:Molybdenum transport system permease n=1 Tax=Desulfobulbus propionicus (strain ATCC 33891 / DSM 2032 / VKM B-1956 / 1pr3) TaxID=577650 RepID=A0A7U3YJ99_DESPD|nr:molybdate ABC transporter permease subunit [Desulfobulbus propionicus]ADW16427.1 molybdate ABC transporter, inner membrane subunit [Desulfobulbus propionicus DSM 2032]
MFLQPSDLDAILLSFKVACTATLLSTPLGIGVAYLLVHTRIPGKAIIEGIVNLPLVLPPVVIGYLLLVLFGRRGWIGSWLMEYNIQIIFTLTGAIIASAVVGFPLLVRSIRLGMELVDPAYHRAARTLGASGWDAFFTVTLPLSGRAVFAGMTLMFARSLGEFGATIILAGNIPGVTQTIPLAIYEYTSTPGGDRMALSLCMVSIILSFIVLLASGAASKSLDKK